MLKYFLENYFWPALQFYFTFRIKLEPEEEQKIDEPEVVLEEPSNVIIKIESKGSPESDNHNSPTSPDQPSAQPKTLHVDTYCEKCDIKFKFMSSYLAHKKNYCKPSNMDSNILDSDVLNAFRTSSGETTVL